jgi:hypothetical protein
MFDFFIDIPFKSSQHISNFEAHWSAVSYLVSGDRPPMVSGVIDTAHHRAAVLITPLSF